MLKPSLFLLPLIFLITACSSVYKKAPDEVVPSWVPHTTQDGGYLVASWSGFDDHTKNIYFTELKTEFLKVYSYGTVSYTRLKKCKFGICQEPFRANFMRYPPKETKGYDSRRRYKHIKLRENTDGEAKITATDTSTNETVSITQSLEFRDEYVRFKAEDLLLKFNKRPKQVLIKLESKKVKHNDKFIPFTIDVNLSKNSFVMSSDDINSLNLEKFDWTMQEIPKEILIDQYKAKLKNNLGSNGNKDSVITSLKRLELLGETSPDIDFFFGSAYFDKGSKLYSSYQKKEKNELMRLSKQHLLNYISSYGKQGRYYSSAVNILSKIDD